MRTLGLIGGTSWVSTLDYYRIINQSVNEKLGGLNSAKLFLYSLNMEEFNPPSDPTKWSGVADLLSSIAKKLESAGAECIIICANTPHIVADEVQKNIRIPLLHIAEATANVISKKGLYKVGLLGTKLTMEQKFFKDRLAKKKIIAMIPDENDREFIQQSIFNELIKGIFEPKTKSRYITIINKLISGGAQGIIFGCTEIPMLIKQEDCIVPVFNTMMIHANAAVDFALSK